MRSSKKMSSSKQPASIVAIGATTLEASVSKASSIDQKAWSVGMAWTNARTNGPRQAKIHTTGIAHQITALTLSTRTRVLLTDVE